MVLAGASTRHLRPEDLRGRRARGLIRESTQKQAEQWSPERQRTDLTRAAEELGLVGMDRWYVRVGSGEEEHVSELQEALADGKRGEYDVLLVIHTSRFARNRAEAVRMKGEFKKCGIAIYFVAQRIVSGSFASALNEGINEVIDEQANEERRYWVAGGIRERQLSGRWFGHLPVGYRKVMADNADGSRSWSGAIAAEPEIAPIIRRIFERTAAGWGSRDLAMELNSQGLRQPNGEPWRSKGLTRIVHNPAYKGEMVRYRWNRADRHYWPEDSRDGRQSIATSLIEPIVTPELWAQANEALDAWGFTSHNTPRRSYPLTGLIHCGKCGHRMYGAAGGRGERYYRCTNRVNLGECDAPYRRATEVEEAFADWLTNLVPPADWREKIAERTLRNKPSDEGKRARIEERLARLADLYSWGDLSPEKYRDERDRLRGELGETKQNGSASSLEGVALALQTLAPVWREAKPEYQAALPRALLRAVEAHPRRVVFVVRAEIKPLLDLCTSGALTKDNVPPVHRYSVRFAG